MKKMSIKKERVKESCKNFLKAIQIKLKENELNQICNKIEELKKLAIENKIHEKCEKIAKILGEWSDWGGSTYYFRSNPIHITFHDNGIELKFHGEIVFNSSKRYNEKANIWRYLKPGKWEKELEKFLIKIPAKIKENELKSLNREIIRIKSHFEV